MNHVEIIDRPVSDAVEYQPESVRNVVIAVAHLLDHFADKTHRGLKEPQNVSRKVHNTGVLVHPRAGGHKNLIGYQLFVTDPLQEIIHNGHSSVVGVIFDMRVYEKIGDRYLFNMLKKVADSIRQESRPSDERLRELSTAFLLAN